MQSIAQSQALTTTQKQYELGRFAILVLRMEFLIGWSRLAGSNQSSVPKAYQEFDDDGRMKPSSYYDRVVDVMEELMKFTYLTRDRKDYLVDRYSERKAE